MKTVTSQLQMANESVVSHQTHHYLSILVNFNVYREKLYQNVSLPIMYTMFPSLTAAWKRQNPPPGMHLICLQRQTEGPDLNIHTNRQLIKVRASLGLIPCRAVETEAAVVF